MRLSDGEKLIILMLTELYEKLEVDGEFDPDFISTAIFNDQLWGIRWKYIGIPFDSAEDPAVVHEVVDILDMWSSIEFAYSKLTDEERKKLAENAAPFGENPHFEGFDGNHEGEFISVASFLVNQLDRFQEFRGRSFNCHYPSIDAHRRMLTAFGAVRQTLIAASLSLEQLAAILRERIHPSRRGA